MPVQETRKWSVLAVLCLGVFLVVVDNTIVNVALPRISLTLGATTSDLQWIVDGYSLPFAGLLLAGGGLADRLGRRRVMLAGLVGFGTFSALAAMSTSVGTLLAARALMGASAAFIFPATLSILTVTFPDGTERAKAFGVWSATAGAAVAFGPVVGGALITHFWYGSIFLVNVPIVLAVIFCTWRYVPESRSPEQRRVDLLGLTLGTSAATAFVLAIIQGPVWGWASATTLGIFLVAAVTGVGFVLWELHRSQPLLDVRIFKVPAFSAGAAAIATTFFGLFGFIFLMTQYFQDVRGYSALSAGVHTVPFAIVAMIVTPIGSLVALRIGARTVVSTGLVIMAASLFWVSTQSMTTPYFGATIFSMMTLSFGFSLISAPATSAIMASLSPVQIGAGAAVNNVTRELGGTLGVALSGSIFASRFVPAVTSALSKTPLSHRDVVLGASSMSAATQVLAHLPVSVRAVVSPLVTSAFMTGFHRACAVTAGIVIVAAMGCWWFLPGRVPTAVPSEELVSAI